MPASAASDATVGDATDDGSPSDGRQADADDDAAARDRRVTDAIADAAEQRDAASGDHLAGDRTALDRSPLDSGPRDVIASEGNVADRAPADRPNTDQVATDQVAADAVVEDRTPIDRGPGDACVPHANPAWWNAQYAVRFPIALGATPDGYTITVQPHGAALTELLAAAATADGHDLRVVWHGSGAVELDRDLLAWNSGSVVFRFKVQDAGGFPGGDQAYFVYLGNAAAPPALADRRRVYHFFEDFEGFNVGDNGTPTFIPNTVDAWSVIDDGGNKVYRFLSGSTRMSAPIAGLLLSAGAVEVRMKYQQIGYRDLGGVLFRASDLTPDTFTTFGGVIYGWYGVAGVTDWSAGTWQDFLSYTYFTPALGTWYRLAVQFAAAGARVMVDDLGMGSWSGDLGPGQGIALDGYNADIVYDDVAVRLLQDPEPTVALGAAQLRCQ